MTEVEFWVWGFGVEGIFFVLVKMLVFCIDTYNKLLYAYGILAVALRFSIRS